MKFASALLLFAAATLVVVHAQESTFNTKITYNDGSGVYERRLCLNSSVPRFLYAERAGAALCRDPAPGSTDTYDPSLCPVLTQDGINQFAEYGNDRRTGEPITNYLTTRFTYNEYNAPLAVIFGTKTYGPHAKVHFWPRTDAYTSMEVTGCTFWLSRHVFSELCVRVYSHVRLHLHVKLLAG